MLRIEEALAVLHIEEALAVLHIEEALAVLHIEEPLLSCTSREPLLRYTSRLSMLWSTQSLTAWRTAGTGCGASWQWLPGTRLVPDAVLAFIGCARHWGALLK